MYSSLLAALQLQVNLSSVPTSSSDYILLSLYASLALTATSLGETLPARMSCVVERIVDQFWKVVYGIPRRSQKVTRSVTGSRSVIGKIDG